MNFETKKLVLVSLGFNVFWLICVLYQNQFIWLALLILAFSFLIERKMVFVVPLIAIAFWGVLFDSLVTFAGVFKFPESETIAASIDFIPLWLVVLWMGFAVYAWLLRDVIKKYSIVLISFLCGVSGASSYFAGMSLGAVEFGFNATATMFLLFGLWFFHGAAISSFIIYIDKILSGKSMLGDYKPLGLE